MKPIFDEDATWLGEDFFEAHRLSGAKVENEVTPAGTVPVLEIRSLPVLIKAIGFLKYLFRGQVFLRGQDRLYGRSLSPTLYRDIGPTGRSRADARIHALVRQSAGWKCEHGDHSPSRCAEKVGRSTAGAITGGVPRYAVEPLLQHYGIRTRWLDVVDNLWVALWFACHTFSRRDQYVHVVRASATGPRAQYVYLLAIVIDGPSREVDPGLWISEQGGRYIDLRKSAPSYYVRPHAQHGLLVRPKDDKPANLQLVAIRLVLDEALTWLGQSVLLSPFGLFPPATVDDGYRRLIEHTDARLLAKLSLGHVDVVGPGY